MYLHVGKANIVSVDPRLEQLFQHTAIKVICFLENTVRHSWRMGTGVRGEQSVSADAEGISYRRLGHLGWHWVVT